jgi:Family of unknown function (DUF6064)
MAEWWTYRPSDFLMFAPRTYWRLFELHNLAWWPAQWLLLAIGAAAVVWLARRPGAVPLRAAFVGLAVAWAFVGWAFVHERFAPIHWVMVWGAWAFIVQALLLAALATRRDVVTATPRAARFGTLALCGWALLVHPLLVLPFDRPWAQAEVAGLAPDPTAIFTLGLLLWAQAHTRLARGLLVAAWALTLAWCAVSAATLWTMGSAQGWVPFIAGLAALVLRRRGAARALS